MVTSSKYACRNPVLTGVLATMAGVAFCVAFQMMLTGDSYLALFAVLIGICSGILGVAALFAWVWGMPLLRGSVVFLGGSICIAVLLLGSMRGADWNATTRREAKNAAQGAAQARAYLLARAYLFRDVVYAPAKNKLVARPAQKEGIGSDPVFVVPCGETLILIVQNSATTYVFDGTTSTRVDYDGQIHDAETMGPGQFVFHGKRYGNEAIAYADTESGVEAGGNGLLMLPKLVDRIAPEPSADR